MQFSNYCNSPVLARMVSVLMNDILMAVHLHLEMHICLRLVISHYLHDQLPIVCIQTFPMLCLASDFCFEHSKKPTSCLLRAHNLDCAWWKKKLHTRPEASLWPVCRQKWVVSHHFGAILDCICSLQLIPSPEGGNLRKDKAKWVTQHTLLHLRTYP